MRELLTVSAIAAACLGAAAGVARAQGVSSNCPADHPRSLAATDNALVASSVATWEAVETLDGIVPDIEEDRMQAPPRWWRYPSALRSSSLLATEAKRKDGLFAEVAPNDLAAGDVLVRVHGAGTCGRMAIVAGVPGQLVAVEGLKAPGGSAQQAPKDASDAFLDQGLLRPEVKAYRINVRKDSTAGHVRELGRDLAHLERTVGERPLLVARGGQAAVDEKVHQLVDEAWSLGIDPAFAGERAGLTGRALVLGAALDWPGAAAAASALLDDALAKKPADQEAAVARAALHLLTGEPAKARPILERVMQSPTPPARARYLMGRTLVAQGERDRGLKLLRQAHDDDPSDRRAADAVSAAAGAMPAGAPASALAGLDFNADAQTASFRGAGTTLRWPVTWRVTNATNLPGQGFVVNLLTGRENLKSGATRRASVVVMAQTPGSSAEASGLVKNGAREMFPKAQRKKLSPLLPGSARNSFKERHDGEMRAGEVNAIERSGRVFYFVLNAPADAYESFRPAFESVVKSFAVEGKK